MSSRTRKCLTEFIFDMHVPARARAAAPQAMRYTGPNMLGANNHMHGHLSYL